MDDGDSIELSDYSFNEILRDTFAFSLHVNKLNFSFYLYKVYKKDVFGNKKLVIDYLVRTFLMHEHLRQRNIPYLEERLYLLDFLREHMDYDQAETFLITLK